MPSLHWIGKDKVVNHHLDVPFRVLDHSYSFVDGVEATSPVNSGNKIIHGDNLLALKSLLPEYEGKVNCVYIDPPYNTGNEEWVYNDNVNDPKIMKWLGSVVGKEAEDLTRHDKWLCMMYPRLKLLHKLLSDDGVIFISIDDNEVAHLIILMDEIFGSSNFIANLPTIMNLKGNQDQFAFAGTHEYTLVYSKNYNNTVFFDFIVEDEGLNEWDEDVIGFYKKGANLKSTGGNAPREKRPNLFFPILIEPNSNSLSMINDDEFKSLYDSEIKTFKDEELTKIISKYELLGFKVVLPISDDLYMSWRWQRDTFVKAIEDVIVNNNTGRFTLYKKQRPSFGDLPTKKPKSLFYRPEYSSGNGTNQIKKIFGEKIFQTPKPMELLSDFIQISTLPNSIILDSFAGSGTTAHAVMNMNKKDGGNRKFILVEMEEYANTITAERVKRVINGYADVEGTGGSFDYYTLGEALFTEEGLLNEAVGEATIRQYIFFTETQEQCSEQIENNKYFLGEANDCSYYFYYNANKVTTLNFEFLSTILKKSSQYIIYADNCSIEQKILQQQQIIFKKIPRDIARL